MCGIYRFSDQSGHGHFNASRNASGLALPRLQTLKWSIPAETCDFWSWSVAPLLDHTSQQEVVFLAHINMRLCDCKRKERWCTEALQATHVGSQKITATRRHRFKKKNLKQWNSNNYPNCNLKSHRSLTYGLLKVNVVTYVKRMSE